jgi:hypothetical protein
MNFYVLMLLWVILHACDDMQTEISHIISSIFIFGLLVLNLLVEHFFFLKIIEKLQCISYLGACDMCIDILLLLLIVAFVKNVLYLICQL